MTSTAQSLPQKPSAYSVLGVRLDAAQIPDVIAHMESWIAIRGSCQYVAVTDMHSLMQAHRSPDFKGVLSAAALAVPDGFPLAWLGRRKGFPVRRRVYGPELIERFCGVTAAKNYRHFFYGGGPGVAADLACRFAEHFPGLQVAGSCCPPFRPLTEQEDADIVARINAARPDVVWVGLGAPKQEQWMFEHRERLQAPVLVGVGAAFDFHTGRVAQAPRWMREHGLEWLFRLAHEPRRLWRRYLIYGPQFVGLVLMESLVHRK
jgi:N-acetylglucosaminyldiphosphoundecaprenol N-acetyl-beta-D-mannosaminyltransferase